MGGEGRLSVSGNIRRKKWMLTWPLFLGCSYWVVQAGLLTPLTFAWHRLSPLAAFTSCAYFHHNERR